MTEVSFSPDLLSLRVGIDALLSLLAAVLWKLVKTVVGSVCSKYLVVGKVLARVIGLSLVLVIHMRHSLIVVVTDLGVVVKTSPQVAVVTTWHVLLHQLRSIACWVVVLSRC